MKQPVVPKLTQQFANVCEEDHTPLFSFVIHSLLALPLTLDSMLCYSQQSFSWHNHGFVSLFNLSHRTIVLKDSKRKVEYSGPNPLFYPLLHFLPLCLFYFLLMFEYSCFHCPSQNCPLPLPTRLPPSILPPLALPMCALYMFPDDPSLIFPHYPSPPSPLVTASLFFISMSLVIFCLLVCFVE